MTGGEGGLQLHYGLGAGPFSSGIEHRSRFTLKVGPASLLSCPASLLSCTPVTLLKPCSQGRRLVRAQLWRAGAGH